MKAYSGVWDGTTMIFCAVKIKKLKVIRSMLKRIGYVLYCTFSWEFLLHIRTLSNELTSGLKPIYIQYHNIHFACEFSKTGFKIDINVIGTVHYCNSHYVRSKRNKCKRNGSVLLHSFMIIIKATIDKM